jgi:general secretion pathway protein A
MYNQFFGLHDEPFRSTPEPNFLFLTAAHRQGLAGLTYAVLGQKGVALLVGGVGTGKTTLMATAAHCIPATRVNFSTLVRPPHEPCELLQAVLFGFGITEVPDGKVQRLRKLEKFIWESEQNGKIPALIIDEVHTLSAESLEQVKFLGNLGLLQILLAGQPEIDNLLQLDASRGLRERISLRLALDPLSPNEVEGYIRHRWQKCGGGQSLPFTEDAIGTIYQMSKGVPRLINSICDNALLLAFEQKSRSLSHEHIVQCLVH